MKTYLSAGILRNAFAFACLFSLFTSCSKNAIDISASTDKNAATNSFSAAFLSPAIVGFNPNPVVAGDSTKVLVQLSKPAPAGGIVVTIDKVRSAGPVADLPKTFFIAQGQNQGSTFIHTLPFKDSIFEAVYAQLPSFVSSEPALLLVTPRPKSDTRPPLQTFEAENAILKGVTPKKADTFSVVFFSNGAYAEYGKMKNSYVLFNVVPNKAGDNILEFRYAWRTSTAQQPQVLTVVVNGMQYPLSFSPTVNNTGSNLVYIRAGLKAGNNKIYLATQQGASGLRLDNLTVAVP